MKSADTLRGWFPAPSWNGIRLVEWLLLEGNRTAVTGSLLTMTFITMLGSGVVWTFEMQMLLTETQAVQTLLNTFLGGIILLVSIVVSINSIVISHQLTSLRLQHERIEAAMSFRRDLGELTEGEQELTTPESFMATITSVILERAHNIEEMDLDADRRIEDNVEHEISEYLADVIEVTETLQESLGEVGGAQFGTLWVTLNTDYSTEMDRSRTLSTAHAADLPEEVDEELQGLIEVLELFATGREYFKTLYYTEEVSSLSRRLLIISLPAILVTATTILAINARLLPDLWLLGLPPLQSFVAATLTVSLSPFIVLTSHMVRLATVSVRSSAVGPFALSS